MREADIQSKIIRWLKSKGCVVLKIQAGPGVPQGFPDLLALYEGAYFTIEVKATKHSKFQPHQKDWNKKLDEWSLSRIVWGGKDSNWPEVQKELEEWLK